MSSRLVVYRSSTTLRATVWLLAALVPLQGFPSDPCCCAAQAKQPAESVGGHEPGVRSCCCCCCRVPQPPKQSALDHSCCRRAESEAKQSCDGCRAGCRCEQHRPSPSPKPIPREDRERSGDQAVGPPVAFSLQCSDSEIVKPAGRKTLAGTPLDRCVLLCRFHL